MNTRTLMRTLFACAILQYGTLLAQETSDGASPEPKVVNSGFQLFGGLGVPLGEFAESDNGAANPGFALAAQYTISPEGGGEFFRNAGFALSASYTNNGTDFGALSGLGLDIEAGSYSNIWALGGLKATLPASEAVSIDLALLLGAVFSSSPEVTATGSGVSISVSSATATAFAISIAGDVVLNKHFTLGLRYYDAKPKYSITIEGSGPGLPPMSLTEEVEQSTSIFVTCVGYMF